MDNRKLLLAAVGLIGLVVGVGGVFVMMVISLKGLQ
jgi:hypothetical protein